jgi:hypothetical protein
MNKFLPQGAYRRVRRRSDIPRTGRDVRTNAAFGKKELKPLSHVTFELDLET